MKDKYGVFDLGLDESQPLQHRLISPEYFGPQEAVRRLESIFNEHHRLPQVYAVKNISTGNIVGSVQRKPLPAGRRPSSASIAGRASASLP